MPAFNQARTIGRVIAAARPVLNGMFSGLHGRLLVADSGSSDDTLAAARSAAAETGNDIAFLPVIGHAADTVELPYHGMFGRARALNVIFDAAHRDGARAVAVVDGATPAITPEWIARLLEPAVSGDYDFVAPAYRRHPFQGALIKGVVQPLFRACFGLRLRQPTGPDFGCSSRLLEHVLQPGIWPRDAGDASIDIWLSAAAATGSLRVCEAALGVRIRSAREEAADLGDTIAQTVGALFGEMERRATVWHRVRGSRAVPTIGDAPDPPPDPPPPVDVAPLADSFRLGYRELADVWDDILPPAAMLDLKRLAAAPDEAFRMDDRVWARIVYDFALGYRLRVIARDHLLRALAPLYLGWLASLAAEARRAGGAEASLDERIERLCQAFEDEKPYLISRWRWPERFRPR